MSKQRPLLSTQQACELCPANKQSGILLQGLTRLLLVFVPLFSLGTAVVFCAKRRHGGTWRGGAWRSVDLCVWAALTLQIVGEVLSTTPHQGLPPALRELRNFLAVLQPVCVFD